MRTKNLKAGDRYATCDGVLVVPVAPVHANYYKDRDPETKEAVFRSGPAQSDPWGPCHPGSRIPVRVQAGVLVDRYETDAAGRRVGDPTRTIVPPRDIKGTWDDYLTLHGEELRRRVEARAEQKRKEREVEDAEVSVSKLFNGSDAKVSIWWRGNERFVVSIESQGSTPAKAAAAMRRLIQSVGQKG